MTGSLTTGVDTIPGLIGSANSTGTDGNDTITATNTTLTALDVINGGLGTNVLNYTDVAGGTALAASATITNVQTINVRSTGASTHDLTTNAGITGVTALNSTLSTTATLTAANTTSIGVSGATDAITIEGGKDVTVTDATASKLIKVGATTVNAGTITVTDTKVGTTNVEIDGGTDVTVTASGVGTGGTIKIGQGGAATDLASGAVVVSSTGLAYTAALTQAMNAIAVKGGKTISVTQKGVLSSNRRNLSNIPKINSEWDTHETK